MVPTTADAVAASVAVAARLGLPAGEAVVVAEGYSVRVRMGSVLTRVVTAGRVLRGEPRPWMEREIAVSRFLATAGAPAVRPWHDPGPHDAHGPEVSLWQWCEPVDLRALQILAALLTDDVQDATLYDAITARLRA